MSTDNTGSSPQAPMAIAQPAGNDVLVKSVNQLNLNDAQRGVASGSLTEQSTLARRPLMVYTRPQVLFLSKSPLVKLPEGMPSLKDWFGDWNEQNFNKKDVETSTSSPAARDRRFRRDPEDAEPSSRPAFRSTLSQPSQMGNFKHQSLRSGERERDRERDSERERERDIRDREGQERLRNLSDKYDRDRLGLPSNSTLLRNRDRESAPHLVSGASGAASQNHLLPGTKRGDARDGTTKKKNGEASEDWRRVAEMPRRGRDGDSENPRRERDDRERPRSRLRDSSRPLRDPSASRRERDRERERGDDRDRDRDRRKERERERDPYRWENTSTGDRWVDDGRWEERVGSKRRERQTREGEPRYDQREHDREVGRWREEKDTTNWKDDDKTKESRDRARDRRDRQGDRDKDRNREQPPPKRDRDAGDEERQRRNGREKRGVVGTEEGREREDRRDREKEKEPAWMETYVPSSSTAGILGGKGVDGELDGIQAWKKGMKEREQKEKTTDVDAGDIKEGQHVDISKTALHPAGTQSGSQLDEIQLFKLMMKREEQKKLEDIQESTVGGTSPLVTDWSSQGVENGVLGLVRIESRMASVSPAESVPSSTAASNSTQDQLPQPAESSVQTASEAKITAPEVSSTASADGSRTLLSLLSGQSSSGSFAVSPSVPPSIPHDSSTDKAHVVNSSMTNTTSIDFTAIANNSQSPSSFNPPAPTLFVPPQGSRLLAFASRGSSATNSNTNPSVVKPPHHDSLSSPPPQQSIGLPPSVQQNGIPTLPRNAPDSNFTSNHRDILESLQSQHGGTPSAQGAARSLFIPEETRDPAFSGTPLERHAPPLDRVAFGTPSDIHSFTDTRSPSIGTPGGIYPTGAHSPPLDNGLGGSSYATGKGSRFAKFFDGKTREGQATGLGRASHPAGLSSPLQPQPQRQDSNRISVALDAGAGGGSDNRTLDDIVAMLNNSAQGHRVNQVNQLNQMASPSGPYVQGQPNVPSLQNLQIHQQQHFPSNNRLDSLYDNRLEDRGFTPDGMLPGLRPMQPPRGREPGIPMFAEEMDDPMQYNMQRMPPQQRGLDQMYPGPVPSSYAHQAPGVVRNVGMNFQPPSYRGNPSPIGGNNPLQVPQQQRLPPGLANLGGRPPHEHSHFIGGGMLGNAPSQQQQQQFVGFQGAGPGFGTGQQQQQQLRVAPPVPRQLPHLTHNGLGSLGGHPGNVDFRGPSQPQVLGINNAGVMGGSMRGVVAGYPGPLHGPSPGQMQASQHMRQQQQQQPPHMMPPHLSSHAHLQHQGFPGSNGRPPTHDLMALLMGGIPRE